MPSLKSREERLAIGEAYHNGLRVREVVERYGVSKSAAYAARVLYRKSVGLRHIEAPNHEPAPPDSDQLQQARRDLAAALEEVAILQKVVMALGRAL